jgi:hypoxia up-regulated 1
VDFSPLKIFGIRRQPPTFLAIKEKKRIHKKQLTVQTYYVGPIQPHSPELLAESQAKLYELAQRDKERMMLEEAKNKVESYIYKIKNKLSDDEEMIAKFSTDAERTAVQGLANAAEDWLYDDGSTADRSTMEAKFDELYVPFEKILVRIDESTARPKALDAMNKKLTDVENLVVQWETTKPQITTDERQSVLTKVDTVRKWIEEKELAQSKQTLYDDPTYLSGEIMEQFPPLEALVVRLGRKPKPKPPVVEHNATTTNSTNTSSTNSNTTSSSANETLDTETTPNNNATTPTTDPVQEEIPVTNGDGGKLDDEL